MLYEALVAASDIGRLQEILSVLVRHGFGEVVQRVGLVRLMRRAGHVFKKEAAPELHRLGPAERTRLMLEQLGTTFVKLGQVLASRTDLLPPEWIEEFSKLHATVTPVPFDELRGQVEKDLAMAPEELFESFETEPLAAGSIAQVHRAVMPDGRKVVLKIRRPGIRARVEADLRLLRRLAELLEDEVSELRRYRPRRIARQFARTMKAELNLVVEAKNVQAIASNLEENDKVVLPEVIEEYTRERLLVMTLMEGQRADEWIRGERSFHVDPARIAAIGAEVILKMVFVDGLYHADPHPGNVQLMPGNRIGLLDFGMVGRLSDGRRREFAALMIAVAERDEEALTEVLLGWSDGGTVDTDLLTQDASALLDRFQGVALKNLDITGLLLDMSEVMRENNLAFPADVSMLIKVFISLEGFGRALDPEFDFSAQLEPVATEMVKRMYSPANTVRRGISDSLRILASLPHDLRTLITRARRGGFKMEFDLERLDHFGHQLDRSANRVTMGMVTSALIVGTSIAMTIEVGPKLFGIPVIGLLGFISSVLLGMALLWSIFRSGKQR